MVGRFLILALCVFSANSLPVSKTTSDGISVVDIINEIEGIINIHSAKSIPDTGVINWPVVADVIEKIEGVITSSKASSSSLTPAQVDNIIAILNEIEGIVNIHSIQTRGVINIPGFIDAINQILGSSSTRTSLTPAQIDNIINILNEIEGIINIHSAKSIPDTGVINWPVVLDVIEKIEGALTSLKARSSLTPAQIDNIIDILNEIEGIVNIHSAKSIPDTGVINWPVVLDVIEKIEGALSVLKARSSLTPAQVDNIIDILNEIEGIVNIHSSQTRGVINIAGFIDAINQIFGSGSTRTTLTPAQVDNIVNILNQIEGIVNIHSLETAPEAHLSEGVVNVPVVIDVINKIESIVGSLSTRATLSSSEVDNILSILNQIEGIINIHSSEVNARSSLTPTQIENIISLLNEIEGIINIHSIPINPRSTTSIIEILNTIEGIVQIH